ncbi:LysR family transcriptional regulator [Bordetella bronchiseptica]
MDRFDQYRVFAQVAEMGSFIKAAHALELPRASVSAAVQQLEGQVGARLLHRTTRQVRLTADGTQLLERIRPLLAEVEDIDQLFQASQRQAAGRLNIDVPSRIARRLVAPALPALLRRHPRLQLALAESYIACCLAGLGLIQIPRYDVQHLLDGGQLVEVMPDQRAASMPVALLYPHRRQRSRRLAVFLEWFEALIQPHLEA